MFVLNDKPAGQFSSVKVIAVNGVINQSISNGGVSKKEVTNESVEIVSKRTYDSKTFKNPSGTYTTQLFNNGIFFFDGFEYVELEKMSSPVLEKKVIPVSEKPESNYFSFGQYLIYKGINLSVENHELVLRDFNGKKIKSLSRPFATDSNNDTSLGEYVFDFDKDSRFLSLGVEIDNYWLNKAVYPIKVDPVTYSNLGGSILYFGDVSNFNGVTFSIRPYTFPDDCQIINTGNWSYGGNERLYRGFIEYNTSAINESSIIRRININFYAVWFGLEDDPRNSQISLTRFNNTPILNFDNYPDNNEGHKKLWNDIDNYSSTGRGYYVLNTTAFNLVQDNNVDLNLGDIAVADFESQLDEDYFGFGIVDTNNSFLQYPNAQLIIFPMSGCGYNSSMYIEYYPDCAPPFSDYWYCNTTCIIENKDYQVHYRLYAYEHCDLQLWGDTNLSFKAEGSFIYIHPGAIISFYNTSKIYGQLD